MAYTDFTLDTVQSELGIALQTGPAFGPLTEPEVPSWLPDHLARGMPMAVLSDKARGEFIVAPILLAVRDLFGKELAILSGVSLNVDSARKMVGECGYLISRVQPLPRMRAPIVAVLEVNASDPDATLGPCAAEMVGAQLFNARAGQAYRPVFGCVTDGGTWQFMRLDGALLTIDPKRRYLCDPGAILAALLASTVDGAEPVPTMYHLENSHMTPMP